MNADAVIRTSKSIWLTFDEIDFPPNARPTNATNVVAIANSIRLIGLQVPLTVIERGGKYLLIAGRHRLEALRVIGEERVPVRVMALDDIEARLWAISENLHRTELSALERAAQIAEWIRLTEEKAKANASQVETHTGPPSKPFHVETVSHKGGRGNEGGVNAAARELGITKSEAHRSLKIDSIVPEAKEALRAAKLDDNQRVALEVAGVSDDTQTEAVAGIVARRESKAKPAYDLVSPPDAPPPQSAKPLRNLENLAAGELARWIKITTPNDRPHVIRMLRECASILSAEMDRAHG